jgi:hypothetical protein
MSAKHEVKSLAEHKRELLARSEVYRQTLALQSKELQQSVSWVPKTVSMAKSAAPLVALGLPLAGMLLFRRKKEAPLVHSKPRHAPPKKGLLAMVLGGVEIYNRLRPLLNAFAHHRAHNGEARHRPRAGSSMSR